MGPCILLDLSFHDTEPMPPRPRSGGLVYSSTLGRTCPTCRMPVAQCRCPDPAEAVLGNGQVRVGHSAKGRGGKTVTLITGLPLTAAALQALATTLKKRCGTGGTVKDGTIEIQGEHRDDIIAQLQQLGYRPKRTGG